MTKAIHCPLCGLPLEAFGEGEACTDPEHQAERDALAFEAFSVDLDLEPEHHPEVVETPEEPIA